MIENDKLRIHVINVGHGDSILVEFPDKKGPTDSTGIPRFGLVDAGGKKSKVKKKTCDYLKEFIK